MKGNQRARSGQRSHSVAGEYKIPLEDRQAYQGNNKSKWVTEKEYKKYLEWVKKGRPER